MMTRLQFVGSIVFAPFARFIRWIKGDKKQEIAIPDGIPPYHAIPVDFVYFSDQDVFSVWVQRDPVTGWKASIRRQPNEIANEARFGGNIPAGAIVTYRSERYRVEQAGGLSVSYIGQKQSAIKNPLPASIIASGAEVLINGQKMILCGDTLVTGERICDFALPENELS